MYLLFFVRIWWFYLKHLMMFWCILWQRWRFESQFWQIYHLHEIKWRLFWIQAIQISWTHQFYFQATSALKGFHLENSVLFYLYRKSFTCISSLQRCGPLKESKLNIEGILTNTWPETLSLWIAVILWKEESEKIDYGVTVLKVFVTLAWYISLTCY